MLEDIPSFPEFRLFTINDIPKLRNYYLEKKLNPYVDIQPENLFAWLGINNDLMISSLDDNILIKYTNILDKNKNNIIPLSNPIKNKTIEKIMSYLEEKGLPPEINEIPKTICNELDVNKWQIDDNRDSYEYILDTDQQSSMQGSNFYKRRRNIKNFEKKHNNINVKYYDIFNEEIKKIFLDHINKMPFNSNNEASAKNSIEPIAIRRNIENALLLHKKAMTITIDNNIVSVAMFSYLDEKTAAINHIKVNYSIEDIFLYTIYQIAKLLNNNNINEMNMEQDLGLPGLRNYKERLQPSRFLEKVTISPKK